MTPQPDRAVEKWYTRWAVHACLVTVLLMAIGATCAESRIRNAPPHLPPDRANPTQPLRLIGAKLEHARIVVPAGKPAPSVPVAGA